jgi:hypothetical protein
MIKVATSCIITYYACTASTALITVSQLTDHLLRFFSECVCNQQSTPIVLMPYCPLVLLPYCPIALLSYCPIALLSHCHIVLLPYCPIVLLPYCPVVLLSYCPIVPLSYCPIALLYNLCNSHHHVLYVHKDNNEPTIITIDNALLHSYPSIELKLNLS